MKQGNIVGNKYDRILVLKIADKQTCKNMRYTCLCDCGNIVDIQGTLLRSGSKKSCGKCNGVTLSDIQLAKIASEYLFKNPAIRFYKTNGSDFSYARYSHPDARRIRRIWKGMMRRCNNPNSTDYKWYGQRGITVCDLWKSFDNFYEWSISHGYKHNLSIDRIDFNGNYEPDNCRWTDKYVQANNRRPDETKLRSVVQLTINGEYIATYCGIRIAQRAINAPYHIGIVKCCEHIQKSAYGYKWMYQDEFERIKE